MTGRTIQSCGQSADRLNNITRQRIRLFNTPLSKRAIKINQLSGLTVKILIKIQWRNITRSIDLLIMVEWQPGRSVLKIAWRLPLNQRTADPLYTPSTISLYIYFAPLGVLFVDSQTVVLLGATMSFLFSGNCHGFHGQLAWHYSLCLDIYLPASTLDK